MKSLRCHAAFCNYRFPHHHCADSCTRLDESGIAFRQRTRLGGAFVVVPSLAASDGFSCRLPRRSGEESADREPIEAPPTALSTTDSAEVSRRGVLSLCAIGLPC